MDTKQRADLENRFRYHPPFGNQAERYAALRAEVLKLAVYLCENTPPSREQSTALTKLDEVMFFSNAAIARNELPEIAKRYDVGTDDRGKVQQAHPSSEQ